MARCLFLVILQDVAILGVESQLRGVTTPRAEDLPLHTSALCPERSCKTWGGGGRGRRRGSGGGAARSRAGERASGPRRVSRHQRRRRRRRKRPWGCGNRGELLPRSLTPLCLAPRAPGGAGGRGAGQGGGAAPRPAGAHRCSERTALAGTLWRRRRCGGPRRCACGSRGRRGERPLPCLDPAGVARRKRAGDRQARGGVRAGRGDQSSWPLL